MPTNSGVVHACRVSILLYIQLRRHSEDAQPKGDLLIVSTRSGSNRLYLTFGLQMMFGCVYSLELETLCWAWRSLRGQQANVRLEFSLCQGRALETCPRHLFS